MWAHTAGEAREGGCWRGSPRGGGACWLKALPCSRGSPNDTHCRPGDSGQAPRKRAILSVWGGAPDSAFSFSFETLTYRKVHVRVPPNEFSHPQATGRTARAPGVLRASLPQSLSLVLVTHRFGFGVYSDGNLHDGLCCLASFAEHYFLGDLSTWLQRAALYSLSLFYRFLLLVSRLLKHFILRLAIEFTFQLLLAVLLRTF